MTFKHFYPDTIKYKTLAVENFGKLQPKNILVENDADWLAALHSKIISLNNIVGG